MEVSWLSARSSSSRFSREERREEGSWLRELPGNYPPGHVGWGMVVLSKIVVNFSLICLGMEFLEIILDQMYEQ